MSSILARVLVFGSSAAVLVLEILAGRLMAPYIGVSLETFTGTIGVVLTGIAAGAWVGGIAADRLGTRPLVGPILTASGLLVLAAPALVDLIGPHLRGSGPLAIVTLTTSAFFLPAFTLSTVPPIVVKLRLSALAETGTVVGSLSALSTIGALVGTFVTGFVLVAAAPTRTLILGMGALLLVAGVTLAGATAAKRMIALAVVGALTAAVSLGFVRSPCDFETTYFCAAIVFDTERAGGRLLRLDNLSHSYVDLQDPTHLEFRYTKTVADVVAQLPEGPLRAAYIGGGGFTLPRYFAATRPGSTATVLEIDGALVKLAQQELGLELTDSLRVEVGDARLRLPDHPPDSLDFVMGDAFAGLSVPWHLTTREFLLEIDRVLTDGGVYIVNIIDYPPLAFARGEVATFLDVFDYVAVIAPARSLRGERGGNVVIVGSQRPLAADAIQARLTARRDLELVWADTDAELFAESAPVLTDDFAPVDQLLGSPPRS